MSIPSPKECGNPSQRVSLVAEEAHKAVGCEGTAVMQVKSAAILQLPAHLGSEHPHRTGCALKCLRQR